MSERLVILGAGESGTGAAILGMSRGYDVFLSDAGKIKDSYRAELHALGVRFEEGTHTASSILSADLIVKSPGIPDKAPLVKEAVEKGIKVISEIEFASWYSDATIVAVTGANGKTTTTALIYHMLQKAGLDVALGGNIGTSFARQVAAGKRAYYVLEISSFQLDGCYTFRPHISVLTNITEDHLDRYNYQFENYIRSKFRITQAQTTADYFVYCDDDEVTTKYLEMAGADVQKIPFSYQKRLSHGAWREDNHIIFQTDKNQFIMEMSEFALPGIHNAYNSMAAGIAAKLLGVRNEVIRESLQDFKSLEHRLEHVASIRGVDFVNDSKATNVNSAWYALETMNKQVVWIAGGVDKGNDYGVLKDLVKSKVKAVICLGKDNEKLHRAFADEVGYIVDATSAQEAVMLAYNIAEKGDVVLLSPACASFDLFDNYEDRGRQFKRAVLSL